MLTHRNLRLVLVVAVGCGGGSKSKNTPPDDASQEKGQADAAPSVGTNVTGWLGGSGFTLRYAAVQRGASASDPIWVCVADSMLTFSDCNSTTGPDRTMFLGPFIYDSSGSPKWGLPQVWLYRVGANAASQPANMGSLTILKDDPNTGALELSLNVDFGQKPVTSGTVNIGN